MIIKNEEQQLEVLKELVFKHYGLDCQFYKPNYLKRRLAVRMRSLGLSSYREYNAFLRANVSEFEILLDRLTINVSHFFRDPDAFQAIKRLVLPALEKKNKVRVWSAGCANGEESYSLAMLLRESIGLGSRFEILATDIDTACLARAQAGIYKETSLTNVSHVLLTRHFDRQDDGLWAVKSRSKDGISARFDRCIAGRPFSPDCLSERDDLF
jgi:chemotaxis protein methyltransferase CheR